MALHGLALVLTNYVSAALGGGLDIAAFNLAIYLGISVVSNERLTVEVMLAAVDDLRVVGYL